MQPVQVSTLINEELIYLLTREVALMRELLANMMKAEEALLEKDPKCLQTLMIERDKPLEDLKEIREEISSKMKEISHAKKKTVYKHIANISLEEFLDNEGFNSCQIMLLRDQIIALTDKMNEKSVAITHLMEEPNAWSLFIKGSIEARFPHPVAFKAQQEKKKGIMLALETRES